MTTSLWVPATEAGVRVRLPSLVPGYLDVGQDLLGIKGVLPAHEVMVHPFDPELTAALERNARRYRNRLRFAEEGIAVRTVLLTLGPGTARGNCRRYTDRPVQANVIQGKMLHCTMRVCRLQHIEPQSRSSWS